MVFFIGMPLQSLAQEAADEAPVAEEAVTAETEEESPTLFERFDSAFGTYVNGPIASVLFFDLYFFDRVNLARDASSEGVLVDGEEVLHADADGFTLRRVVDVVAGDAQPMFVVPTVEAETPIRWGYTSKVVEGEVSTWLVVKEEPVEAQMVADLLVPIGEHAGDIPGSRLEVQEGAERFVLTGAAPLPVVIDRMGGPDEPNPDAPYMYFGLGYEVERPDAAPSLEVGGYVWTEEGSGQVLSIDGGVVRAVVGEPRSETGDLANPDNLQLPLVVVWLILGALFFTLRMNFVNLRAFKHAILVTAGKFDDPDDVGEISHFKALSSALSATVGLGNIAGVAIAVSVGGPGAIPWMIIAGFLGMSSKVTECTLGQMYRVVDDQGRVSGGPMRYLDTGLQEMNLGGLGKVLAVIFAVMCIGGSLGGGNMFQANQSYAAVAEVVPLFAEYNWLYGLLLALAVGMVILGGIKRIGSAAGMIVPVMCTVYVLAGLYILVVNGDKVGDAFGVMFSGAFSTEAGLGGVIGAMIQGFRRAAFSNEAGVGSASIAHSAAATNEPVREGIVALLEPFIDTIVVCTMTGLVVVITGAYLQDTGDGVLMTSAAFGSTLPWFPLVLSFAVVMFAFSTMISWSYYGERCATYLFGPGASLPYKLVFLVCCFVGTMFKLGNVLEFSDLMVLGMAFPNILGLFLLSGKVRGALDAYWGTYIKPTSSPG